MTFTEQSLFDLPKRGLSADKAGAVPRRTDNRDFEERRRILAEERTGQIVIKVKSRGYLPLSVIYFVEQPPTDCEPPLNS